MVSNSKKVIHIAPNGEKTIYSNLGEASKATGLSYVHLEELKKRKAEVEQKLSNEEDKMKQIMDRIEEYKKLLLHYDSVIKDLEAR